MAMSPQKKSGSGTNRNRHFDDAPTITLRLVPVNPPHGLCGRGVLLSSIQDNPQWKSEEKVFPESVTPSAGFSLPRLAGAIISRGD
jgi:hypothetical protein